jgi:hypothetical protein
MRAYFKTRYPAVPVAEHINFARKSVAQPKDADATASVASRAEERYEAARCNGSSSKS